MAEVLTKAEREAIRAKCRRQYRSVDDSVRRGEDAVKRYGNWAGPTIERLLDTCDALEEQIAKLELTVRGLQQPILQTCAKHEGGGGDGGS